MALEVSSMDYVGDDPRVLEIERRFEEILSLLHGYSVRKSVLKWKKGKSLIVQIHASFKLDS